MKHAAWIAAGAAMLAAVLTVASTAWTTYSSAKSSESSAQRAAEAVVRGVEVQLSGETEKSKAEFLRARRQEVYVTAAEHLNALEDAQGSYWAYVDVNAEDIAIGDEELFKRSTVMSESIQQVFRDRFSVGIIGTRDVVEAFDEVVLQYSEINNGLRRWASYRTGTTSVDPKFDYESFYSTMLKGKRDALTKAFRIDIGSE